MSEWIVIIVLIIGTAFVLLAAVGVLRMPDLYSRMHASTKAGTLGVSCLMLAVAIHFGELGITTRALLVIAFLFLTAPVAATIIANAAYFTDVPQWEGTVIDELSERHDLQPPTPPSSLTSLDLPATGERVEDP
jgi:multicomponent Na+:H+ antiporter subunit G